MAVLGALIIQPVSTRLDFFRARVIFPLLCLNRWRITNLTTERDMTFNENEFKARIQTASSVYVQRKHDNSGTYVGASLTEDEPWFFDVPNHTRMDGEWLYYSTNVADAIRSINPAITVEVIPLR